MDRAPSVGRLRSAAAVAFLAVVLAAATAGAHPQSSVDGTLPQPNPAGANGGVYEWNAVSQTSLWEETSQRLADGSLPRGMFADPSGDKILGLQLHNVCLGTFTPSVCDPTVAPCPPAPNCGDPAARAAGMADCLNCHHLSAGSGWLFTYLPWGYFQSGTFVDGTQAACEAQSGTFVPKDTFLYGQYDDLSKHLGVPATQCFPTGYGR
jgi:hypothetical protein